ncbi:uncharacterized protein K02A2.6-like, partial [Aedes albopictus]|uniref:Endonuclease n=1 Tax=Aedes albopictus TaxID=7160 RepID=A0ABM1XW95_AEDAL
MASPDAAAATAAAGAAGHAMPASFNFEPFNAATAKFDRWLERLEISFRIYKVAPADKRDYLLHYMGSSTYDVLCNKLQNQSPGTQTYADIVALLRSHYSPAPLEILENYKFICRKQLDHEALCDYITDLEKLAQTCNFGAHLDTAIRNQFVFGLRNRTIQSRLLEVRNLTLAKAKEIAFSMEMSHRGTDEIHGSTSKTEIQYLEHGKQKKKKPITKPMTPTTKPKPTTPTQGKACYRCGDPDHFANKCRHQSTICNFCKRKGHLEKVCQTKLRGNPKKAPEKAVTHHIEDSPVIKDVFHLRSTPGFADKFMLDLKVDGRTLTFEVDTGSPVSLISSHDQRRYFKDFPIHPTATKLVSYCDTDINVPGKIFVKVMSNGDELTLPLHVAESNRHPIMGRDWLLRLNIDFNSVFKPGMNSISHSDSSGESTPNALNNLLTKYSRVFDGNVGKITGVQASLNLRADAQPVYIKHRPVAFSVRDAVEKEIDKFVKDGVWEKVDHSDWATPVVPVRKAGGKVRLCGDYKVTVNPHLLVDDHPLPTVEELFATVAGGEKFSKIDLSQAYLQLEVREEDRGLLTLSTHKGLYRPTRLMYGVASAPAVFQRLMEQILQGIPGVTVFIDDIRVTGPDDESHLRRLEEVLKRLEAHGMRANRDKCEFFSSQIDYCGYSVDKFGIHKLQTKVHAIQSMPVPSDKEQVRSFVGLVSYYGRFFPNLSTILYPLNNLLKDDVPFLWSKECDKSFNLVKREMQSGRFLVHFDTTLPLVLATDASPYGVGAVLSHRFPDGTERPLQYASQTLTRTQQKYSQIDKEAYAIVFGIRKFYQYLFGRKFTLVTDNKPVSQIFSESKGLPTMTAMRMQHYAAFLQNFDYRIRYRRSSDHCNADAMSRLPVATTDPENEIEEPDAIEINSIQTLPLTVDELGTATLADSSVRELLRGLRSGRTVDAKFRFGVSQEEFSLQKDCIMRACRQFFSTYGIPSVLVSDNGPQFTSGEFAKFLDLNGVVHKFSAPYHPATNGQAERFIQTMKLKLKAIDCNRSQIHGELCSILMSYRKMIHPTTGLSPSMMVYGRQIRSRLDLMVPSGNSNDREAAGK